MTTSEVEERIAGLGHQLPEALGAFANYATSVLAGNLLFLSGHGPVRADGELVLGKLGRDLDVAAGRDAAVLVALNALATIKAAAGSLERVRRFVKVLGMVNCTPDFVQTPDVVNGFSDLITEVYGDRGRHARSAVGVTSLPMGIPVEIETVVELEPDA